MRLLRHDIILLAPVGDILNFGTWMRAALVGISKVSGSVVWLADGEDGGFYGDEDGGDDDVSSFGSDSSWVESGAVSAVTASFVWLRLSARGQRALWRTVDQNFLINWGS
jgi:hypothetical protein